MCYYYAVTCKGSVFRSIAFLLFSILPISCNCIQCLFTSLYYSNLLMHKHDGFMALIIKYYEMVYKRGSLKRLSRKAFFTLYILNIPSRRFTRVWGRFSAFGLKSGPLCVAVISQLSSSQKYI